MSYATALAPNPAKQPAVTVSGVIKICCCGVWMTSYPTPIEKIAVILLRRLGYNRHPFWITV